MSEEAKEHLFTIVGSIIIGLIVVVITICMAGCAVQETPYDPNAPELKFLGATDPNWVRDFGDTRETRELYNICLNRGLINRDRQVLAEVCKRMLELEKNTKVIEDGLQNVVLKVCGIDPNLILPDPNEGDK